MKVFKLVNKLRSYVVVLCSIFLLTTIGACEDELVTADLEVSITGTFSGVPREGISVTLYFLQTNANDTEYPVSDSYETDANGQVVFLNIDSGVRYWVRAETLLTHEIKQTDVLKAGSNDFEMTVL